MNEFTKQDLIEYITVRKNALLASIDQGVIPGIQDSIELHQCRAIFDELCAMENWFS